MEETDNAGRRLIGRATALLTGAVCLVCGQLAMPTAEASETPSTVATASATVDESAVSAAQVPVLGSVTVTGDQKSGGEQLTVLVHGVRRIDGATVLYFSAGLPTGSPAASLTAFTRPSADSLLGVYTYVGRVRLVDFGHHQIYLPLIQEHEGGNDEIMVSPENAWPSDQSGGTFYTFYTVMPELPDDVETIDVMVGNADIVHDVPVEDGVLEPAVEQTGPIELGQAWPKIDEAAAASWGDPGPSVYSLDTQTSDLDESVTNRSGAGTTSVDLSSDVLFEVDSAELEAQATTALTKAAKQVNETAAGGEIRIVGHTDNTGGDAHNLELSKRRAQAVADELEPLITVSGVTFTVSGKGETDPVASNSTADGRKQNRRVSVVFSPKDGE